MTEEERERVIDMILKNQPQEAINIARTAFFLGHEDGWWLSRTNPNVSISPVDHARKINPFPASPILELVEERSANQISYCAQCRHHHGPRGCLQD
jgi:hypothetical protein